MHAPTKDSNTFPYTTLFRSLDAKEEIDTGTVRINPENKVGTVEFKDVTFGYGKEPLIQHLNLSVEAGETIAIVGDRKSTRLNSSHVAISYAVFCLSRVRVSA